MKLRAIGFSPNGLADLSGTIVAYSDSDEPLGIEHTGNYSKDAGKRLMAKLAVIGIDLEVAQAKLHHLLAQLRNAADESDIEPNGERPHDLPVIVVTDRYMREIVADCWKLIREENSQEARFFRFGKELSEVATLAGITTPKVFTYTELYGALDRKADFISRSTNAQGETKTHPARPPKDVVQDILALVDRSLPRLAAVVSTPICRPDGSIATESGYDPTSQFYLDLPVGLTIPSVSAAPSTDEVHRSLDLFDSLLVDFPSSGDGDRAHAHGLIMLPFARPMIDGPTPLHMVEAPTPGTGKGLLVEAATRIATGRPPSVMTEGHDDDEWRKRLTARLITAPQMILIDNIRRRLDSGALSAALTAPMWEDRYLGQSRTVTLPVTCTWAATANNPAVSDEIARRVVRIRLDAETENPWERTEFVHPDLRGWVRDHRGELIWAVLTLVRAWVAAGRPNGTEPMGSFESWAATIGGILKVAGVKGFLSNRQEVYAQVQAEMEAWRTLVQLWARDYGDQRVGVDKLFELAKEHRLLTELRSGRSDHGARVSMGIELSKLRDRLIGGYRVRSAGHATDGRALMYRLELHREARAR